MQSSEILLIRFNAILLEIVSIMFNKLSSGESFSRNEIIDIEAALVDLNSSIKLLKELDSLKKGLEGLKNG